MKRFLCLTVAVFGLTSPAHGYIDRAPTLGRLLNDSTNVVVLRVEKVRQDRHAIIYSKVANLKGQHAGDQVKHEIAGGLHPREYKAVLDWATPGKLAVCFHTGQAAVTCIGPYWYESAARDDDWWAMTRGRSELSMAYVGTAERLRTHVTAILAGQEVVITAVRHEFRGFRAYQAVYFKDFVPGTRRPVWRLRASLQMQGTVEDAANDPRCVVGLGAGGPEEVPPLLQTLRDPQPWARAGATDDLALIGVKARAAVPALREALKDPDGNVRVHAAAALAQIDPRNPDALPALLTLAKEAATPVRRAALESVGNLGPKGKSAVPDLVRAAQDVDADIRWAAVEALGRIGPAAKSSVPILAEALKEESLRVIAADALGGIGPAAAAAAPALARLLGEADPNLRWTAAAALVRIEDVSAGRTAGPIFVEALKSNDPRTRWDGAWYLERLGSKATAQLPALTALLKSKNSQVRAAALDALEKVGPDARAVLPAVEEALKDDDEAVRLAAAQALIMIGDGEINARAAVAVLVDGIRKSDPRDREYVLWYLRHVGGQEKVVLPALVELLGDRDAGVRSDALRCLQQLDAGSEAALSLVRKLLKDNVREVRLTAAETLWLIDHDAGTVVPVFLDVLHDIDHRLRARAAAMLGEVGAEARTALPALRAALADKGEDMAVRLAAAEAVWQIDQDAGASVPLLVKLLKDNDDRLWGRTATVLGKMGAGAGEAAPALAAILETETADLAVRLTVAEALWRINQDVRTTVPVLVEILEREDEKDARVKAAAILENMGPAARDAIPALSEALDDPDPEVRAASARALTQVSPLQAEPQAGGQAGSGPNQDRGALFWGLLSAGFLLALVTGWVLVRSRQPRKFGAAEKHRQPVG
jgi:HEAT repeat protein